MFCQTTAPSNAPSVAEAAKQDPIELSPFPGFRQGILTPVRSKDSNDVW